MMTTDACTLPTAERPMRLSEFENLFADHVTDLSWSGDRLELSLSGAAGLRERVADLAARESACCSFFDFALSGSADEVVLEVGVPPERREILDALAALAEGARR
ncbi:MAG: hypothetical protein QOD98_2972 [Nocardioidaceae bacterium]|nr:hypothetical protein [Nocardioidaceae bacterium]